MATTASPPQTTPEEPRPATGASARPSAAAFRPHVAAAIFKRNVANYFINPAGYVFITLFVLICSWVAFCRPEFFSNNLATLDTLNEWMPYLLLFFVPAITMSIWAEERRQGTEELLLTLPARDLEVVLGKYLAALGIYTVALGFALSLPVLLLYLGRPDPGVLAATFLGYWLMGAMLLSVGMVASILSSNVTVAFILGALFCAIPVFSGSAGSLFQSLTARQMVEDLSVASQFRDFGSGVVSASGVFYFLGSAAVMLFLNMVLLGRRHWAGSERAGRLWGHAAARTIALAVALGSATILIANAGWRGDATEERLHTLTPESRLVVDGLPKDRQVLIRAFYSPEVPREFVEARNNLLNLLRQFAARGGSRIRLALIETEPYSEEAAAANALGITSQQIFTSDEARRAEANLFLGVVFTCGGEEARIPFVDPGLPIEYEIARSLKVVTGQSRKRVGVLTTDAQLVGGAAVRGGPEWEIVRELRKQYEVKTVSADSPIARSEVDALVAAMPSTLTQPQMDHLKEYILAGGPTLIFDDPLPLSNIMLSPEMPKPTPGRSNMMFGAPPQGEPKGNFAALLREIGVSWPSSDIVWNPDNPHPQIQTGLAEEILFLTNSEGSAGGGEQISSKSPITRGMQEIVALFAGRVTRLGRDGLEFTPLLRTSKSGGLLSWRSAVTSELGFGDMDVVEAAQMAMQLGLPGGITLRPRRPRVASSDDFVIAAHVHPPGYYESLPSPGSSRKGADDEAKPGSASGAAPRANVIFVADLDMISDTFFDIRRQSAEQLRQRGMGNLVFDNVSFVLNCVDALAGDTTFLEIRKRRPRHRTLENLERQTRKFAEAAQKKLEEYERQEREQIEKAQTEFNKDVDAVVKDDTLEPAIKEAKIKYLQEVANRRLEKRREEIENETRKKIEESKIEKEREIRKIQNWTRTLAVVFPPLLPAILGLAVFVVRAGRENLGANPNRLA